MLQPTGTTYRAPERTATSAAGRSAALPRERPEGAPLRPSGPLCSPGEGKEATRAKDPEPPAGVRPPAALPASGAAPGAARQSPAAAARSAPPARAHLRPRRVSGRPRPQLFPFPAVSTPPPRPSRGRGGRRPARPADNGAGTHQHDGEALLQLPGLGHGQLEGHAVRPELRLLRVHAPRVPHGGGGGGPSALLRAPRSPSSTPRRRPSWLAALALPPGRARSGSGSAAAPPHAAARPAQSPLRPPGPRRAGTRSPATGLWERGRGGGGAGGGGGRGRGRAARPPSCRARRRGECGTAGARGSPPVGAAT